MNIVKIKKRRIMNLFVLIIFLSFINISQHFHNSKIIIIIIIKQDFAY